MGQNPEYSMVIGTIGLIGHVRTYNSAEKVFGKPVTLKEKVFVYPMEKQDVGHLEIFVKFESGHQIRFF